MLLQALENHQLEINAVDAAGRARLLQYPDRAIADRAGTLFQSNTSDRMKVAESYQGVLKLTGNPVSAGGGFSPGSGKSE